MIDQEKKHQRSTIMDIAREAGVSISTVSRVLNANVPVSADTAERVWRAIEQLDFIPNSAAKRLASQRANIIGLILPEIGGVFFPPMLRGVERCAREQGFDLLIYSSPPTEGIDHPHKKLLGEHNTDGLLVFTTILSERELAWYYRRGFPVVLLHRSPPQGMEMPSVVFENRQAAESLIDHLIEAHGCRRIAFLRGPVENEDSYWREAGYRSALERHSIPLDLDLYERGNFDAQMAFQAVHRLLDKGIHFDAIFAGDDDSSAGVFLALKQHSLRVPEDVRVVGFDDTYIAPLLPVPLTTVHVPIEEAGYEAARQLVNLIKTGTAQQQVVFPTQLVIRRSCGCCQKGS
jgi:DNA-binding LacI/PurR family transcriptional regulator